MAGAGPTKREQILEAIIQRLQLILQENGYRTDLGAHILVGRMPRFGEDDPDQVIAVLPKEDQVGTVQLQKIPVLWPIDIALLLAPDSLEEPWPTVEAGLQDVKRAIEDSDDRTFGGLLRGGQGNPGGPVRGTTESFPRHSGSEVVGALITYGFPYTEVYGNPEG
jgi:hypothetical protein